jgi:hypothetical protein
MVDPFLPFIQETLTEYPALCASRLYEMSVSDLRCAMPPRELGRVDAVSLQATPSPSDRRNKRSERRERSSSLSSRIAGSRRSIRPPLGWWKESSRRPFVFGLTGHDW